MLYGRGSETELLSTDEVLEISRVALSEANLRGKSVLVLIPDSTRTAPVGQSGDRFDGGKGLREPLRGRGDVG